MHAIWGVRRLTEPMNRRCARYIGAYLFITFEGNDGRRAGWRAGVRGELPDEVGQSTTGRMRENRYGIE